MEFRTLKYFLTIAQELNFTKASALLHVTQPTLSRQIMQLEDELGVKLFTRSSHSIILTPHGKILQRRAQEIIDMIDKTKEEIKASDTPDGQISIGCGEYKSCNILGDILFEFQKRYANISYQLFSGNADDIKNKIENGSLDFGFLIPPVDVEKYDYFETPFVEHYGVYVPSNCELATRPFVTPNDIAPYPIIHASRQPVIQLTRKWFGNFAQRINVIVQGNLPYNSLAYVSRHLAVFFCLELDYNYPNTTFVPIQPEIKISPILVWKRTSASSTNVRTFIQFAKEYIFNISIDKK